MRGEDRLMRIGDAMAQAMQAHCEYREGDGAIVLLDAGQRGAVVLCGHESEREAISTGLAHMAALCAANDIAFTVIPGQRNCG
jgi:hypothetical protein